MKKINILVITIFAFALITAGCGKSDKVVLTGEKKETASIQEGNKIYRLDTATSKVEWLGKKVTGQHNGTIEFKNGEFGVDGDNVTAGKFEIDMNTIVDLDLTDEAMNKKLVDHLKSDDFFSVEQFPLSTFEITKVEPLNNATKPDFNHSITGNITIRDVTKSISFPANVKIEDDVLNANADFDIDRTEFGLKFLSGKFFKDIGDKMIYDNFNLKISIIAKP
ncbi:MAG: YceI family protein [Ignavibacteria bacterium]|nr:YceI family protein [Ignavibacteria bacterium]